MPRLTEWSVKAMTLIPRRAAARASSSIDSFPSDQVECVCRSALMSATSISCGSFPALAACTSPRSSRSSGGIHGRPRAA